MSAPGPLQWGAAFGAVQSEGAALASDWFAWERAGEVPPSLDGNGFALDHADDLRLLRGAGASMVRLTLDWSRLEPQDGKVDGAVADRYRTVLEGARAAGLAVWVALVDGPLPGWFAVDEHGWRDRRARSWFWPRHVERVAEAFGDLVAGWVPILRPVSFARGAFVTSAAPPGVRSTQRFVETVQGSYLASLEAWRVLRGDAPVGLGVEGAPVRQGEVGAERPTRLYDTVQWAWAAALRDGELAIPRLPVHRADELRDAFDAVALTFDGGYAVGIDGRVARHRTDDELPATLHRLAEAAGDREVWVVGHTASQGDPKADAEAAEAAISDLEACRRDGIDLRLWVWEPAIDGYEGAAGFEPRLGLFDRDRVEKPAVDVLRRWSGASPDAAVGAEDGEAGPSPAPEG